ncbi:hypothetical protein [Caproiciproducens sp.]
MPVWLLAITFSVGIAGTAFSLTKAFRRRKSGAGMGAAVCAAAVFGLVTVLSALYLAAALLLLGGVS